MSLGWKAALDEEIANMPAWDVLESLDITLYKGEEKLVTNTLTDRYQGTLGKATPSPFNYGSEGNKEWVWDRGTYELREDGKARKPDKVVVEIKIKGSEEVVTLTATDFSFEEDPVEPR